MSEDQLIQLIYKTIRQWADEEAEENDLSEYEREERYAEMLDDIGEKIKLKELWNHWATGYVTALGRSPFLHKEEEYQDD